MAKLKFKYGDVVVIKSVHPVIIGIVTRTYKMQHRNRMRAVRMYDVLPIDKRPRRKGEKSDCYECGTHDIKHYDRLTEIEKLLYNLTE